MKLETKNGTLATALKCSMMSSEQSVSTGSPNGSNLKWRYPTDLTSPSSSPILDYMMSSETYLIEIGNSEIEIVNFYSEIMKQSIRSSRKPCRHFFDVQVFILYYSYLFPTSSINSFDVYFLNCIDGFHICFMFFAYFCPFF